RAEMAQARGADCRWGAALVGAGTLIAGGRMGGRPPAAPPARGGRGATRRCAARHGSKAMRGATLYTSGEPCAMCMGAILWCGFGRLVFAASVEQIAAKMNQINVTSAEIAAKAPFAKISITGRVLADEPLNL